jgi:hypothetical protein
MISNFSEVEKSLKRCLKEKVSITAATVVGFLIAGTVAFGDATPVTFTTTADGQVTVNAGEPKNVGTAKNSISVADYETLTGEDGALNNLLTLEVDGENGILTFKTADISAGIGTVTATATKDGALTLISTDSEKDENKSITSSLTIDAKGVKDNESVYTATAMSADGEGHTVTNDETIDVKEYAVGMSAKNGGTAVNNAQKTITVNGTDAVGMSVTTDSAKGVTTLTNNGTITVAKGIGISVAGTGEAKVAAGTITVANAAGNIGINIANTETGTTTVTDGTIEVTGQGTGIKIAANAGTGTTTVKNTNISLVNNSSDSGTGIDATGNVTLEDIAITLTGAGTGIEYNGGEAVANAKISIGDTELKASGATGIKATMSNQATSTLDITTGSIATTNASAFGIKIAGGRTASTPASGVQKSTAIVTTTLGTTVGTGVEVTGKANYGITVNLENVKTAPATSKTTKTVVSGTGVKIASNEANGGVIVKVNQKDLSVAEGTKLVEVTANDGDVTMDAKQAVELVTTANLVDIGAAGGNITVNLDADGQSVATGSLVNVGAIKGTTNVNINKDVTLADNDGRLVKAAGDLGAGGILNINLNVEGEKGLNVVTGKTAIDLSAMSSGTASVKNTGNVTINENGTLLAGSESNAISLTNQGLIDLTTVNGENSAKDSNSKISTGAKVKVANYGTITLKDMDSRAFLAKVGGGATLKTLTLKQVGTALKDLGVVTDGSEGNFLSVGYIKFSDGELFTTAQALAGEQTVDNLAATLNHQSEDKRAFAVDAAGVTLTANSETDKLENVQFNLNGTMKIDGIENEVTINNAGHDNQIHITDSGNLEVAENATLNYSGKITAINAGDTAAITVGVGATLTLSNANLNMVEPEKTEFDIMTAKEAETNRVGIKLTQDAKTLVLDNSTINADIKGSLNGDALKNEINSKGISAINGTVTNIKDIKVTENGMLKFGANSTIVSTATGVTKETTIDLANGKMGVQIGENGNNVLKNSTLYDSKKEIKFTGISQDGKVVLLTDDLTKNTKFDLGNHTNLKDGDITVDGDIYYTLVKGEGNNWNATFNEDALLKATGTKYLELNNMYIATQAIHDLLEKDPSLRIAQLDDLYSNNIYSETVKMSLDTLKMNEDAVLSLNVRPKQGEFTAQGKFLFNNTDYDREGVTRDYKVETKNTGLLGAMEYGLTDTSSVGFAFSGTKQDLDMKNGASADGDAFYFGLYRNDTFNNIDLTTGLGYMIDRVDAENFIGKDKFDSTALSGYIQGKYNYAIGENLTLSPKARLTVTRFQQDSINNGRMKQEEIKDTMADVELGVELKKGIALETGKMNLLAGASFTTNVAGKDDDYYKVNFISKAGNNGASTKVKGANLEKNSLKLNLGADVELTNGVFYNGGLSYEFDDEDRDSIGVTLGAGYKF